MCRWVTVIIPAVISDFRSIRINRRVNVIAISGILNAHGISISMDGRGHWRDNVFVERLWKSVKYEDVYLKAYCSIGEARQGIREYFDLYNNRRRHQSLDRKTPDYVYWNTLPQKQAVI